MSGEILLIAISLCLYFLPGTLIVLILQIHRQPLLFAYTLSTSVFAFCLFTIGQLEASWTSFYQLYAGVLAVLAGLAAVVTYKTRFKHFHPVNSKNLGGILLIVAATSVYFLLVGPYNELPADHFRHIEIVQYSLQDINDPATQYHNLYSGIRDRYWYYLYAIAANLSAASFDFSLSWFSWLNVTLLLIALFQLGLFVFRQEKIHALWLSLAGCLLFAIHHGVIGFATIRYYALAPMMLSFPIYLLIVSNVLLGIQKRFALSESLALVIVFMGAVLIHIQEALFALSMSFLIVNYFLVAWLINKYGDRSTQPDWIQSAPGYRNASHTAIAGIGIWLVLIISWILAYRYLDRETIDLKKVIDLQTLLPFTRNLYILNPANQFYLVITLWGLIVYGLFLTCFRKLSTSPYLIMGMLSPLLTVFNPLFVDLYLRFGYQHVLYRFTYMVPLHFVAVYGTYLLAQPLFRDKRYSIRTLLPMTLFAGLLIVCLFPLQGRFIDAPYSHARLNSLARIPENLTPLHWHDLIDYLRELETPQHILTDPVTGYMIGALTIHNAPRYKFTQRQHININHEDYSNNPLARYKGSLLIINLRNGERSESGRLSGHWPQDILTISPYYSQQLRQHIADNPDRFSELWHAEDIRVYRIKD